MRIRRVTAKATGRRWRRHRQDRSFQTLVGQERQKRGDDLVAIARWHRCRARREWHGPKHFGRICRRLAGGSAGHGRTPQHAWTERRNVALRGSASKAIGRQPASSRERSVAAATAFFISGTKPFRPISTVERRRSRAARRGDIFPQRCRRRASERWSNSPEPATVSRASFSARGRRQAGRNAGFRQRFREQKDIGRSRARHRRHRVHQRFVVDPFDRASCRKQADRASSRCVAVRRAPPRR